MVRGGLSGITLPQSKGHPQESPVVFDLNPSLVRATQPSISLNPGSGSLKRSLRASPHRTHEVHPKIFSSGSHTAWFRPDPRTALFPLPAEALQGRVEFPGMSVNTGRDVSTLKNILIPLI